MKRSTSCACKVHVNVCLWVWLGEFLTDVILYVAWARCCVSVRFCLSGLVYLVAKTYRMPYFYRSFSAKEPGARGDGAIWRVVAAHPLDRTRAMRIVEIWECIQTLYIV